MELVLFNVHDQNLIDMDDFIHTHTSMTTYSDYCGECDEQVGCYCQTGCNFALRDLSFFQRLRMLGRTRFLALATSTDFECGRLYIPPPLENRGTLSVGSL